MSRKKAAIVTLTVANYGNRLQNLATQWVFEELGYDVETIHNPYEPTYSEVKHRLRNVIKRIIGNKRQKLNVFREDAFDAFDRKYVKYSKYWINNAAHRSALDNEYDVFVCGSDQLWNPTTEKYGANNFAMFAADKKKVTMAPSFGVTEFPNNRVEEFKAYLNSFCYLSVREETGAQIVKELTGREATVVIDPTLMIQREKWEHIEKKPQWLNQDEYILCYALGSQYMMKWVQEIADKNNCKVVNLMNNEDRRFYCTDPAEFLYLTHHCKLMVTDSFHGSVFSIMFEKPLVVMDRKDEFVSMNTRLDNLLEMFGIQNRRFSDVSEERLFDVEYAQAYAVLSEKRQEGNRFLKKALEATR